jgi:hypothetical protein
MASILREPSFHYYYSSLNWQMYSMSKRKIGKQMETGTGRFYLPKFMEVVGFVIHDLMAISKVAFLIFRIFLLHLPRLYRTCIPPLGWNSDLLIQMMVCQSGHTIVYSIVKIQECGSRIK